MHAGEPAGAPAATGTIVDDDEAVEQVWLARFGRTVAIHVVDVVGDRGDRGRGVVFAGNARGPAAAAGERGGGAAARRSGAAVPCPGGPRAGGRQFVPPCVETRCCRIRGRRRGAWAGMGAAAR